MGTIANVPKEAEQHTEGRRNNVDESLRYQAVSRVRRKIEDELTTDVEILRKNYPDLYDELREVVCE